MKVSLGQPVIIENVAGANGTVGTGRLARARSDGYTLAIGTVDTHVINGATEDLTGLIAWLKSNPDKAFVGTAGPGLQEIAGVLFQKRTGTRFGFVRYRGGAPVVQDVVGGQIDLTLMDPNASLAQVRAGNVAAPAVRARNRRRGC